jgi:hypothetical protein
MYFLFITALLTSFEITIAQSQIGLCTRWNWEFLERVGNSAGDGRSGGGGGGDEDDEDKNVDCIVT